jgi:hypothetical protein
MTRKFDDAWLASRAKGDGLSYPADKPVKRIDYVFLRKGELRAKKSWVVNSMASDHLPVVVEVEVVGAQKSEVRGQQSEVNCHFCLRLGRIPCGNALPYRGVRDTFGCA